MKDVGSWEGLALRQRRGVAIRCTSSTSGEETPKAFRQSHRSPDPKNLQPFVCRSSPTRHPCSAELRTSRPEPRMTKSRSHEPFAEQPWFQSPHPAERLWLRLNPHACPDPISLLAQASGPMSAMNSQPSDGKVDMSQLLIVNVLVVG